jgi:aryl-alcohol dehydrogenase-like predicted oxidoreductase
MLTTCARLADRITEHHRPSATSLAQLDEIVGAAHLKLDADAIKRLNEATA